VQVVCGVNFIYIWTGLTKCQPLSTHQGVKGKRASVQRGHVLFGYLLHWRNGVNQTVMIYCAKLGMPH